MTSTDLLLQQRVKECRRLAAAARKASDKVFWLGLVERWQVVESRSVGQHYLRQNPLVGHLQNDGGRGDQAVSSTSVGASPVRAERRSRPRGRRR
jgi:hypothetical protein